MSSAVRTAVPDGESILDAWWLSTISIESKNLAAMAANEVASTEPIEKFGTMIDADGEVAVDAAVERRDALARPARRADEHLDAVGDGELDDRLRDGRHRDIHRDIGAEHLGELALRVDLGVQLELGGGLDDARDELAHLARRADDGDLGCHPANLASCAAPSAAGFARTRRGNRPRGARGQ